MSMKKMLALLLAGAMTISLAACGSKTPDPSSQLSAVCPEEATSR